jgi:hypothetical protein
MTHPSQEGNTCKYFDRNPFECNNDSPGQMITTREGKYCIAVVWKLEREEVFWKLRTLATFLASGLFIGNEFTKHGEQHKTAKERKRYLVFGEFAN